jgi:hypothetical protein
MIEFPHEIPELARVEVSSYERRYLLGGEVHLWKGDTTTVESVVPLRATNGALVRHPIGEAIVLGS